MELRETHNSKASCLCYGMYFFNSYQQLLLEYIAHRYYIATKAKAIICGDDKICNMYRV